MKICLIGATHPCHNPRLVREADTLVEFGHEVRVVAPCHSERLAAKDRRLMSTREWRLQQVDFRPAGWCGRWKSLTIRGRRRAAEALYPRLRTRWCAELAYSLALPELKKMAVAEPADWFIGHTQAALPVAAAAARQRQARLGFDCEDLLSLGVTDPVEIVTMIERKYMPACDYVSVPSHAVSRELSTRYGVAPEVLYNVFPRVLAAGMGDPLSRPSHPKLRLHWFGQVVGPGRGIEDAVNALAWLGEEVELHLRGSISDGYRSHLCGLASQAGTLPRITFYPQVDHDELIQTMGGFDVGLALERPDDGNYRLTVTNKVFTYLLAGLAVILSETPGQMEALAALPGVGRSYSAGDPRALANLVGSWVRDPAALRECQQKAWEFARNKFCWDVECHKFLRLIENGGEGGKTAVVREHCSA